LIADKLVSVFEAIRSDRMQGVPILNPNLSVEAVDFREWRGHRLGILITPWFMNLMLLPGSGGAFDHLPEGAAVGFELPAGTVEFLVGREDLLGIYLSRSLFSPMSEFGDQGTARLVARETMKGLMTAPEAEEQAPASPSLSSSAMSKRDFLRGAFSRGRG
jgi:[NiFe] hydrogenase assembly chaperone, HybE family